MAKTGFIAGLIALIGFFSVFSPLAVITAPEAASWYPQAIPPEVENNIEYIVDVAISPDYDRDNTLFVLAWGGSFSLWRVNSQSNLWVIAF